LLSSDDLQRGHLILAKKWAAKLIELGRRRRYPPAQSLGWVCSASAASFAEDHEKAMVDCKLAVGTSHGYFERIMAESAQGVVLVGAGWPAEGLSLLARLRREVIDSGYLVQLTAIEIPIGAAMVAAGDYAGGVADLENTIARFSKWGNPRMLAWGHFVLGEVYRGLAGKLPPSRILRQNASFFVRAIPAAKRRARKHLEEAVRFSQQADTPGFLALALASRGFLSQSLGQQGPARAYLEEARAIAEGLGAEKLVQRIDAALPQDCEKAT
jgi:hypothetical protein